MEDEIKAINEAFDEVVAHLRKERDSYMGDMKNEPNVYRNIKKRHVVEWLIESL